MRTLDALLPTITSFFVRRAPRAFKRHVSGAVPATNCSPFRRFSTYPRLALGVGSMNVADPVGGGRRREMDEVALIFSPPGGIHESSACSPQNF